MNGLIQMRRALNVFKQLDPEMPMSTMVVFLAIAMDAGEKQEVVTRDLIDELNLSPSAVNRAVTTLGEQHWSKKKDGLRLIEVRMNPEDKRLRLASLTPKGAQLMDTLEGLLA